MQYFLILVDICTAGEYSLAFLLRRYHAQQHRIFVLHPQPRTYKGAGLKPLLPGWFFYVPDIHVGDMWVRPKNISKKAKKYLDSTL